MERNDTNGSADLATEVDQGVGNANTPGLSGVGDTVLGTTGSR